MVLESYRANSADYKCICNLLGTKKTELKGRYHRTQMNSSDQLNMNKKLEYNSSKGIPLDKGSLLSLTTYHMYRMHSYILFIQNICSNYLTSMTVV